MQMKKKADQTVKGKTVLFYLPICLTALPLFISLQVVAFGNHNAFAFVKEGSANQNIE